MNVTCTSFTCSAGLCGNFDGDKDNDLVTKAGKTVNKKQPDEFSAEWRSVNHCQDPDLGQTMQEWCPFDWTVFCLSCLIVVASLAVTITPLKCFNN